MKLFLGFIILTSFTGKYNNKEEKTKKIEEEITISTPLLKNDFIGFKEALAFKESQGKYNITNKLGYVGKYQFGKSTLDLFKIKNTQKFLDNPELQEKAFEALCKINKWILRDEIEYFVGKRINGVLITESGILAAAHLGGARRVKKHLNSYGKQKFKDAFGTTMSSYLKKFSGYDTSYLIADRKARII